MERLDLTCVQLGRLLLVSHLLFLACFRIFRDTCINECLHTARGCALCSCTRGVAFLSASASNNIKYNHCFALDHIQITWSPFFAAATASAASSFTDKAENKTWRPLALRMGSGSCSTSSVLIVRGLSGMVNVHTEGIYIRAWQRPYLRQGSSRREGP